MKNWKQEGKWYKQRVKNFYHWLVSMFYVAKFGYPAKRLTVIGVTGTDGKTTTSTLIYEMLRAAGGKIKPALLTTVAAKVGDTIIDTGLHTTDPDARVLQSLLAKMVSLGVTHLVLEVTAHGIDQYRVMGTNISIGVLTNITHDHLDDFITMKRYREAKLKMFKTVKFAVLNKDDSSYEYIRSRLLKNHARMAPLRGDISARDFSGGSALIVPYGKSNIREVSEALQGEYNLYNLGAAVEVAKILGIDNKAVAGVAKEFKGVPGRREEVRVGQKFKVFVDFAHTPNGLESVLRSLKSLKTFNTQLIVVFGCTGERDREKRPAMGRIAVDLADVVIVTSDDTRGESQEEIVRQILAGVPAGEMKKVTVENDRKEAIRLAISKARPGDVILLAGKGHEKSINLGGKEFPWSDVEVAKEILGARS